MNPSSCLFFAVLFASFAPIDAARSQEFPLQLPLVWQTPSFRPEGFQFEIQLSSLGTSYDADRIRQSIRGHNLGEYESVVSKVIAAEWGYSFTHLDGQLDGAGRRIQAGYPTPPRVGPNVCWSLKHS